MTTDHAAAAAEEIAATEGWDATAETDTVAAIIRRHYAERERLLRRAVELIASDALESRHAVAADFRRRWLRDAAKLGITGDEK